MAALTPPRKVAAATALVSALIAGLTGCVDDSPNSGAATPLSPLPSSVTVVPAPGSAPITDSGVLSKALLAPQDLPAGYSALDLPPAADDAPAQGHSSPAGPGSSSTAQVDRSSTTPPRCAGVLAPLVSQSAGAVANVSITFTGLDFSSVDEDIASYPADGAQRAFAAVQDTATACRTFTGTDADGVAVNYEVGGLDHQPAGEGSVGYRVRITSSGVTLTSDAVIAVVGSSVMQVVLSSQQPSSPATVNAVVGAAVQRLRGVSR